MIDTNKAWEALNNDLEFVDLSAEKMELLFRPFISKANEYLADVAESPVTLASLADARLRFTKWAVGNGELLRHIKGLCQVENEPVPPDELLLQALAEVVSQAEKAAEQAKDLPEGAMTEELMETHHRYVSLKAKPDLFRDGLTIGALFEALPQAVIEP